MTAESEEALNIIRTCFQCGTCSASCPVRMAVDEFNPVKISRMILLGFEEELIESPVIWLCARCNTCVERCPRGIAFVNVINYLQNKAARREKAPRMLKEASKMIVEKGWIYDFESYEYVRSDLGLPPPLKAEPTAVRKIAKLTGLGG